MADFPIPEAATIPESQSNKKGQFGVALEPEVIKICGFALLVGFVGGLVEDPLHLPNGQRLRRLVGNRIAGAREP